VDGRGEHARWAFSAVTTGETGPAEEQDLFDALVVKAARERM
jgi:hypothetical protein